MLAIALAVCGCLDNMSLANPMHNVIGALRFVPACLEMAYLAFCIFQYPPYMTYKGCMK